ncbi:LysM peptidoglycan-binding domain-containing protein [Blastococcus atacamensis]|uniref:LysM peptidoglycan-binding domain-containing protein n=1 Tax=Blastococcus atacamensis TaxID=2070508 RepID=UPI0012FFE478|nr:LysM peptidoglycan-binding domain-containing protein [Blastococcus atacamensis]
MTSNMALAECGVSAGAGAVAAGRGAAGELRAERHLRVLPPPAAYAVVPGPSAAGPQIARSGPRSGSAPAPRLRLTARGRRLVAVLALSLGVGVLALGDALSGGDEDGLELMGTSSVVVERGDTLWGIAGSVAGDEDIREVVARIVELNGLDGGRIAPGQVLQLP